MPPALATQDACEYLMEPGVLFNYIFKALTQRKHPSIRAVHKGTVAQVSTCGRRAGRSGGLTWEK